ncbi:MAG: hydantoinase/carbamoylase family amidase [Solirubrobacterales bacterium]|nr:hydantoinase/carbamoylase family amidase [Solirubrobacterales bacterium]
MTAPFSQDRAAGVISRLRELDAGSGGRRVAWTDTWDDARAWFAGLAREVPGVEVNFDACGNMWARLRGDSERAVAVGSHLDCVPDGGWLDGVLGVLTGLGLLEALAGQPRGRTLVVVDWADEEGARFGRSLLGSSAAVGLLAADDADQLEDTEGARLIDEVSARGFDLSAGPVAEVAELDAYVELHIEQGPVLEAEGRPCAGVAGCLGVRRWRATFQGQAAHAGTTPMDSRRDPIEAAARLKVALGPAASETRGLATIGEIHAEPNVPTAIAGRCAVVVDLRHADRQALERLDQETRRLAADAARVTGTDLAIDEIWAIAPVEFDPRLVALATEATGGGPPLTSGALHDAAAVARAGIPTAMMFASSAKGLSHTRKEDTPEPDLIAAISAFSTLVRNLVNDKELPHGH